MVIESLRFTPLEILTTPLWDHIKRRREKRLICPHGSPYFNPSIEFFRTSQAQLKIVFIHVGKCAGESIMTYLRCALPPKSFCLFEYHVADSNRRIPEILKEIANDPHTILLISTRDPLDRWVASFNWDFHNTVLSSTEPLQTFMRMIEAYPSVVDLARGIARNEQKAMRYGRLEHMGMGISWYLPATLLGSLPAGRTYTIKVDTIHSDLARMLTELREHRSMPEIQILRHVPQTKDNYKDAYPANTFGHLHDLPVEEINAMKAYLRLDYEIHHKLTAPTQHGASS